MKQVVKKAVAGVIGLSLAAAFSAKAETVTVADVSDWSKAEVVNLDLTYPALGGAGYNGGVYAGINTLQITANSQTIDVNGFCIDPYHWSAGGSYSGSVVNLAGAPKVPGPMSATAALEVEDLWAEYYTAGLTSSSVAGGLQLAIWEVVSQSIDNGAYFLLDPGQSGPGQIGDVAAQDIASLASYTGPAADLVALTSSTGQDYVIDPVPEGGTTVALLGLALAGLGAWRKKKY